MNDMNMANIDDTEFELELDGLVGRCFLIWGEDNQWSRQGVVRAELNGGYYLVQFFEVVMGTLSTMAIYHISQFAAPEPRFQGKPDVFEFFKDNEQLRDWVAAHR
jgi:hypothetical protein